jgi:protoporphyrinogen oxidase
VSRYDVLIIGNGVVGLSTAYALATEEPTLNIGVIGPFDQLGAAIHASGAILGCFGEITKAEEIKNRIPRLFYGVSCPALIKSKNTMLKSVVRTPDHKRQKHIDFFSALQ